MPVIDYEIIKKHKEILRIECDHREIDYKTMNAIITIESAWKNQTARYEKNFIYTHKADHFADIFNVNITTEVTFQRFSYGFCQIMGGTARDLGFNGWLPDLCNDLKPELNIFWGCEYFQRRCENYVDLKDKIAAYNAGSVRKKSNGEYLNQDYVDKVMKLLLNSSNN